MVGRGAMGNPHIFKEINYYLEEDDKVPTQTAKEKIKDFWKYVKYCEKFKLDNFSRIKEQATYFTKGMKEGARVRDAINLCKDMDTLKKIL
jgi:tRNA-dihydrouridine synthase